MQVFVEICVCVCVEVCVCVCVGAGTYVSACAVTSTCTSFAKSRSPAGQPGKARRGSRFAFYEKLICFLCFAIIFYNFVVPLVGGKPRTPSVNHLLLGTVLAANQSVWLIFRRIVGWGLPKHKNIRSLRVQPKHLYLSCEWKWLLPIYNEIIFFILLF